MMNSGTIQEMHDLRKKVCTCKKLFVWPLFHEEGCTYQHQGMAFVEKVENEYAAKTAQEG